MSKRFTDKNKWDDEWYLSLGNDYRNVWEYILDHCTAAGRWKKNLTLLNFCCQVKFDDNTLKEIFNGRIIDCGEFYFLPKYLKWNYASGLNSHKPAIIGVRKELIEYNLVDLVKESLGNNYLMISDERVIVKDKDKRKNKNKNKDKDKGGVGGFSEKQCIDVGISIGIPEDKSREFFHWYNGQGWKFGGKGQLPIENLPSAMQRWKSKQYQFEKPDPEDEKQKKLEIARAYR